MNTPLEPWALQDAKAQFSEVVTLALTAGPQRITRRGKDAVVVVAASTFDRLTGKTRSTLVSHLLAMPKGDGQMTLFERRQLNVRTFEF